LQSINQINQAINQAINQLTNQLNNQSVIHLTNQSINQSINFTFFRKDICLKAHYQINQKRKM